MRRNISSAGLSFVNFVLAQAFVVSKARLFQSAFSSWTIFPATTVITDRVFRRSASGTAK